MHYELHGLYPSLDTVRAIKSRRIRRAGHAERIVKGWGVYKILVRRPEGRRLWVRHWRRWDGVKMDLWEIGIYGANWMQLAQVSLMAGFCELSDEPLASIKKVFYFLRSQVYSQFFKEYPAP